MTDDTPRTVADVPRTMLEVVKAGTPLDRYYGRYICQKFGIDPDMPYDQFRRRLAMGERAEKAGHHPVVPGVVYTGDYSNGWTACLDYIRGDQ
jgi:hypothetical protein